MTVDTTWKLEIGGGTLSDITDTVLGFTVDQPLEIRQHQPHTAQVTLNNNDGRYTPGAGGTFSSFTWFDRLLRITATVGSYTSAVFDGIIVEFDVNDDGVNSTVTFSAIDGLSLAGRAPMRSAVGTQSYTPDKAVEQLYFRMKQDGYLPELDSVIGSSVGEIYLYDNTVIHGWERYVQVDTVAGGTPVSNRIVGDEINNRVGASDYFVYWQQGISNISVFSTTYRTCLVSCAGTRQVPSFDYLQDVDPYTFTFTEGTPGAAELPLRNLKREFTIDRLVNDIDQASTITSTDVQLTDTASTAKYGVRTVSFTSAINENDADLQAAAQNHLNRFSEVVFTPTTLDVTAGMVYEKCASTSEQAWSNLLDAGRGLYQLAHVQYTPTGTVTQSDDLVMVMGRRIRATPNDTVVSLTLRPAEQLVSLELDNTDIGVLDTNRLG